MYINKYKDILSNLPNYLNFLSFLNTFLKNLPTQFEKLKLNCK